MSAPSRSRSEAAGPPRFLVSPDSSVLRSVTPVRPPRQANCGASVLPSALPTASTLTTNAFRSSITQPTGSLCTLRSLGYPSTTQHSVPAAGQLYRTGFPPAGDNRKVSVNYSLLTSSLPRLGLAHGQSHLHVIDPSSSEGNRSEVAASMRLVLMLPLREVFRRMRFMTIRRMMAKLLAAKPVRTLVTGNCPASLPTPEGYARAIAVGCGRRVASRVAA